MLKVIIIALAILLTIIEVGAFQDYLNDPTRGCTRFDTGTAYDTGYHCKRGDIYVLN